MSLIKGQRFKGAVNAGWGTIICRNDQKGCKKTTEAYNVQFDHGKFYPSWWRCHIEKTEWKLITIIRVVFKSIFK
tara:strand:- start:661 stop:885 length:225 start_codon:yes stop_codon:yes gene_type:complete